MYIDKQILALLVLSVSAAVLTWANFAGSTAKADTGIKDRDYSLVTARSSGGGDSLYVMDSRTGLLAVFVYDPNVRGLRPRKFVSLVNVFNPR
jgi:hypothetical protein